MYHVDRAMTTTPPSIDSASILVRSRAISGASIPEYRSARFHSGSFPALFPGLAADFLMSGLRWAVGLRRADEEREFILFETCIQPERPRWPLDGGTSTFKRALIGIGESAPIRDR